MDELFFASATTLADLIRRGSVTATTVVAAHLERIAAVNPQLNAVVQLAADQALAQAHAADRALAAGDLLGPLHGVPMTIKDSFDTAGIISTWGTPGRRETIPQEDATVVARLKAAGAILLGKTNTPEFTYLFETDNNVYGRTSNPYNPARSSGGSSGGGAAIIAAGGSPLDLGTDTGGSIRLPAAFCGIAGIKPTTGRVPRTGHAVPPGGLLDALTQVGPMARRVEDLALVLPIIAGPDMRDPFIAPVPLRDDRDVRLDQLRGVVYTDDGIVTPQPAIVAAVEEAAAALGRSGVQLAARRPPGIEETLDLLPALARGWDGGAWARMLLARAGTDPADSRLQNYLAATSADPATIVDIFDRWDTFRSRLLTFMAGYDLILAPANARTAIEHGSLPEHYRGFGYTMAYNLTGWPGAVVRVGEDSDGLPIGVQVIAQPWREDVALAVVRELERIFGGWQPPRLDAKP